MGRAPVVRVRESGLWGSLHYDDIGRTWIRRCGLYGKVVAARHRARTQRVDFTVNWSDARTTRAVPSPSARLRIRDFHSLVSRLRCSAHRSPVNA